MADLYPSSLTEIFTEIFLIFGDRKRMPGKVELVQDFSCDVELACSLNQRLCYIWWYNRLCARVPEFMLVLKHAVWMTNRLSIRLLERWHA